jgi:hypothetical protein
MSEKSIEEAKEKLKKELKELEDLEQKVSDKKSDLEYKKLSVPFKVGQAYFIRTVTYFATGKVKAIVGNFLVLEDAAWIADTGRFREAIMKGILNEVEPVEVEMFVNINSITDAFDWKHKLPRDQK